MIKEKPDNELTDIVINPDEYLPAVHRKHQF